MYIRGAKELLLDVFFKKIFWQDLPFLKDSTALDYGPRGALTGSIFVKTINSWV